MIGDNGKRIFDLCSFGPLHSNEHSYIPRTYFLILMCLFLVSPYKPFLSSPSITFDIFLFLNTVPFVLVIFIFSSSNAISVLHGPQAAQKLVTSTQTGHKCKKKKYVS